MHYALRSGTREECIENDVLLSVILLLKKHKRGTMQIVNLVSEMVNLSSIRENRIKIHDTLFSNSHLDETQIVLGCGKIIEWIYFVGNDPFHQFQIERLDKKFIQFMESNPVKEFFIIKEESFAFTDIVTEDEKNAVVQYVKDNYKPFFLPHYR